MEAFMNRFEGTLARQLELVDEDEVPVFGPFKPKPQDRMRLLKKDIYAELTRRRRQAQIAARHKLQEF
jgi:hypothetical protein